MFRAKTVLVLGAGASVELGLPMGEQLLEQIRGLLDIRFEYGFELKRGDRLIVDALKAHLQESGVDLLNHHLHAGHRVVQSSLQAPSIDNLVDALEDDATTLISKMAIVRAIHQAESASLCSKMLSQHDQQMDLSVFQANWYNSLSKLLFENVRRSDVNNIFSNLEIINFNYDRCLESYLPHSLSQYYNMTLKDMKDLVNTLPVHRPYGIAGSLHDVKFGGGNAHQLAAAAQGIRTFTEQLVDETALSGIKSALEDADRIIFLGFAFHRQNLKLLEAETKSSVKVLATSLGISRSDCAVIARELNDTFKIESSSPNLSVELAGMTCSKFFNEYWRTLTAGAP